MLSKKKKRSSNFWNFLLKFSFEVGPDGAWFCQHFFWSNFSQQICTRDSQALLVFIENISWGLKYYLNFVERSSYPEMLHLLYSCSRRTIFFFSLSCRSILWWGERRREWIFCFDDYWFPPLLCVCF